MRNITKSLFYVSLVIMSSSRADANLTTTFDSSLEGWTSTGGVLSYSATGGNPGGFLRLQDNVDTFMTVFAPSSFYGDLLSYLGGILAFDAKNLNDSSPDLNQSPFFGTVTITGSSGSASRLVGGVGQPPNDSNWHSYSATLDPALWSGNLEAALSNVTNLSVTLESNISPTGEFNGFDNFSITAVPEPSSLVLGLFGMLTGFSYWWRRQRRGKRG